MPQTFPEMIPPRFGQRRCLHGPAEQLLVVRLDRVELEDVRDRQPALLFLDEFHRVALLDLTFARHREIKAAAATGQKTLDEVTPVEANSQFKAGDPRLRHAELRRPDAQPIADSRLRFRHPAFHGEVLAKRAPRQVDPRQLPAPVGVMFGRVKINRLIDAAVHREIGLPVAVEVQRRDMHPPEHRLLPDRSPHGLATRDHFPRQPDVDRNEFHQLCSFLAFLLSVVSTALSLGGLSSSYD